MVDGLDHDVDEAGDVGIASVSEEPDDKHTNHVNNEKSAHEEFGLLTKKRALETKQEKRSRWVSILVVYFSVLLLSLGFSLILTGVWPYLKLVDPTVDKTFLGWVVAANPLGQLILSTVVGFASRYVTSIRWPCAICMLIFAAGNMWYSLLDVIHDSYKKYWMVAARFFVGASSAILVSCRAYLSAATTLKERTTAVALVALAQALGFILGPAIQAALTPIGEEGISLGGGVTVNMYTAAGWIAAILGVIDAFLFLPYVFQESNIAAKEAQMQCDKLDDNNAWQQVEPDYIAVWSCLTAFFVTFFTFVLLETLGTPLTMDQFGWTESEAIWHMGLLMSVGAIFSSVCFAIMGPLSERVDERMLLLVLGFLPMFVALVAFFPFGSTYPPMAELTTEDTAQEISIQDTTTILPEPITEALTENILETDSYVILRGCPPVQEWCRYTPALTFSQLIVGYGFSTVGYPFCMALIHTIYSKVLGAIPQGVWMAMLTVAGSLARVVGPVFIGYVYTSYGTFVSFGLTASLVAASGIQLAIVYKRLVPPKIPGLAIEETQMESRV